MIETLLFLLVILAMWAINGLYEIRLAIEDLPRALVSQRAASPLPPPKKEETTVNDWPFMREIGG